MFGVLKIEWILRFRYLRIGIVTIIQINSFPFGKSLITGKNRTKGNHFLKNHNKGLDCQSDYLTILEQSTEFEFSSAALRRHYIKSVLHDKRLFRCTIGAEMMNAIDEIVFCNGDDLPLECAAVTIISPVSMWSRPNCTISAHPFVLYMNLDLLSLLTIV